MKHKKHHSPKSIRINEKISKGRCQSCNKVSEVFYFCEKNLYFNKKLVEIILCKDCLNKLILEISEGEDKAKKVFLPILKFMRGDKVEVIDPEVQNKIDISVVK